jgi:hypothetical protein
MNTQTSAISQFRQEVYHSFEQRADAALDLIDAVTSATTVESPVAVSESPLFRRRFSSVYDVLEHGVLDRFWLRRTLYRHQPDEAETIAGYEVYAVDCTEDPHAEAHTLPDRHQSRKGRYAPRIVGHRYSWLARLVQRCTSWCMPQDVERVGTASTDSQVASDQVERLDKQSDRSKVIVADSLYGNAVFLRIFLTLQTVFALVRLRSNRVLYEEPPPPSGKPGRPRKHGAKFKLSEAKRTPDRQTTETILGQTVRLQTWHDLHFYKLPMLVGLVLCIEFLKADGTPRFRRPIYLFWTGPTTVPLEDLCRMYLWRFAIEHMFRFLKQHMGLSSSRSPSPAHNELWMWCCALAYSQLLLIRGEVTEQRPPWHPRSVNGQPKPMTTRQVQRVALPFLLQLGTPARPTQPAGKAPGRPKGYRPSPRPRYQIVRKGKPKTKKRQ